MCIKQILNNRARPRPLPLIWFGQGRKKEREKKCEGEEEYKSKDSQKKEDQREGKKILKASIVFKSFWWIIEVLEVSS